MKPIDRDPEFGVRPPFGVVVLGDGSRVQVENSEALRSEVLETAERIREHRRRIDEEIGLSSSLEVPGVRAKRELPAGSGVTRTCS